MLEVNREEVTKTIIDLMDEHEFKKTKNMWNFLTTDPDIQGAIKAANRLAVRYLGYTDHGLDHVTIASRNVLQIVDVIKDSITPAIVHQGIGDLDDATLVCVTAEYLHDVGHLIHRDQHELASSMLAKDLIFRKLQKIYPDMDLCWDILSHILHAIYAHDEEIQCLTPEAGIVTIADGLDMCAGRSRKPFDMGKVDIHSISALSISSVDITKGTKKKPLRIDIHMLSEAGVFQVEEIFLPKVYTSGLEDEIEVNILVDGKPLALSQVLRMYDKFDK